jgi:tetratricopeptide (TPR) repeat protein
MAHEAGAQTAFRNGDWNVALDNGLLWMQDEPFSSNASTFASYIASIGLGDHHEALRILEAGLVANPDHWLLLNNQAFSLANLNETDKASAVLKKIKIAELDDYKRAVIRATEGAIHFRRGEYEAGRAAYREAVETFSERGQARSRAIAVLCWAREEAMIGEIDAGEFINAAVGSDDALVQQNADIRALAEGLGALAHAAHPSGETPTG